MESFEEAVRVRLRDQGYSGDDASALARRVIARRDALAANGGKRCSRCHSNTPLLDFLPAPTEDGLKAHCVACGG